MFTTKKAARQGGYFNAVEWRSRSRGQRIPKRDAVGINVKREAFFSKDQCEELVSKPEAKRRGLGIRKGAIAADTRQVSIFGNVVSYELFRLSDCEPKQVRREIPADRIDLLHAVFTVNRAAKRFRDLAQIYYQGEIHGFARTAKNRKEELYRRKDRGIMVAYRDHRLQFVGVHAKLALYRGEGCCFHTTLLPGDAVTPDTADIDTFFKESALKETNEARLKDACYTLAALPTSTDGFVRLDSPQFKPRDATFETTHNVCDSSDEEDEEDDEDDEEDWDDELQ